MYTIRCADCGRKVYRYRKIGEGRVLRCWYDKIVRDYSRRVGDEVRCECGKVIGHAEAKFVRMTQSAFTHTGSVTRG